MGNDDFGGKKCFKKFYFESIIPFYNKKATEYLNRFFDEEITIEFDNNLNEKIIRNEREKIYRQFSGGEKTRLDFSMILTNNALSKLRMSDSFDFLFLEEVLDGYVDKTGMEKFMDMIIEMGNNILVFLTSHRDHLIDKFNGALVIEKKQGDSYIKN